MDFKDTLVSRLRTMADRYERGELSKDEFRRSTTEVADELENLQKALRQVIDDCEVAGNLSYAAGTARRALGLPRD